MAVTEPPAAPPRNPGPDWGFAFVRWADRRVPRWVFRSGQVVGTTIAFVCMPGQRRCAAAYWRALTGEAPTRLQLWRQFFAFGESFIELLRLGQAGDHRFNIAEGEDGEAFTALAASLRPALFGTFHVGNSDLLGYALNHYNRRIHMIRTQVGNSPETGWLEQRFSGGVSFIWVDRPEAMLFAIKKAIEGGHSLAMKCDRLEQSSRREYFWFLGARRLFPFTIYHLSMLFNMPVAFAMGWPLGTGRTEVSPSAVFEPDPAASREANLERARGHFQTVLRDLEARLRRQPTLWFNFVPLNPESSHIAAQKGASTLHTE